jgi:hypothetical protein
MAGRKERDLFPTHFREKKGIVPRRFAHKSAGYLCQLPELAQALMGDFNASFFGKLTIWINSSRGFRWAQLPYPPGGEELYLSGVILSLYTKQCPIGVWVVE